MSKHNEHTAKLIEEKLRRDFPNIEINVEWKDNLYLLDNGDNIPPSETREAIQQKLEDYIKEVGDEEIKETPKPLRRVRIQNDGGPGYATKLTDADTGQPIDRIFHIRLVDLDVKEIPKVLLWQYTPVIDVTANAEIVGVRPCCGTQKPDPQKLDDKFKLKLTVDDTDLDLSIDKLKRLQALQRATSCGDYVDPGEAVWSFMEWFMGHKDRVQMVSERGFDTVKIIKKFLKAQGWEIDQEHYTSVRKQINAKFPE